MYHLYNRGVDKRVIFTDDSEYQRFLACLRVLNSSENINPTFFSVYTPLDQIPVSSTPLVGIGAFTLMPNHYHLYATPLVEGGISKFMQKLSTAYTMYFNEKYKRTGSLFQGTFKAQHVNDDNYARYIYSYIHINCGKLKDPKWKERGARDMRALKEFITSYPYSSLREYLSGKHIITNPDAMPEPLIRRDFESHITDWITTRDQFAH